MEIGGGKQGLTSPWSQNSVTTKVSDLDHHAVVNHAAGGLKATMDFNVTGVEI